MITQTKPFLLMLLVLSSLVPFGCGSATSKKRVMVEIQADSQSSPNTPEGQIKNAKSEWSEIEKQMREAGASPQEVETARLGYQEQLQQRLHQMEMQRRIERGEDPNVPPDFFKNLPNAP